MEKPNQDKDEHEKLDKGILNGYETTDEYILDRALWYSDKNKKKLMQARALRRLRRLRAVDEDQRPSISPPSAEAGLSSRNAAGISPVYDEPVARQSLSSEEQEETQSNQTDNSGSLRSPETWGFSPISQPTSPVAAVENPPLNICLVNNIPLMSILSIYEPRQESSNSSGTVPKDRTRNAFECNATSDRNALDVPPTPRPLDLTCIRPMDLRVEELLSSTASEISEHGLNLKDGTFPSHQTSPITPTLSDISLSETIRQGIGSTVQPSLRKRPESVSNSELPPWKRYSRGLTNQTVGTQTLKRPSAENRVEILAVKRILPDMSTVSGMAGHQTMKPSCSNPNLPTSDRILQREMSGPDIQITNNNQEDGQKLCQKCLKDIDRPISTFPENSSQPFQQSNLSPQVLNIVPVEAEQILNYDQMDQPFSNYTEEPMDNVPESDLLEQFRHAMPVNEQILPNSCLERSNSMIYNTDAANQGSTYLTNHQQNTQQTRPNVERPTAMALPGGDNQLRSTYMRSRQENRQFVSIATDEETQTRPSMGRSASMVFAPGQLAQTFSNHRGQILQSSLETDRDNQIRSTYPTNRPDMRKLIQDGTDSTPRRPLTRSMLRSASMVFKPGQTSCQPFSNYREPAIESSSDPDNTGSSSQFQPYPARNLEQSASMMFTPGEVSQASYAPIAPPPVPTRVETAYQHNVQLNPTAVYDTGQMAQPNFVQPNSQRMRPTAYSAGQMIQQNYMQNNIQPTRQRGFYNTGQLGQPNYQHVNPTQNTSNNVPTPHYFTRRVRAALDAARPRYTDSTCMSVPGQQYPPPTQFSAYSGAGAGYPEQSYNAGYGTPAMPPPPIYVCRHCNKTYKTNTGLKNHLRRVCERNPYMDNRNPYDRYPMR